MSTIAEAYRGTFVEGILEQLTAAMSIPHGLGAEEEARLGAPPRITWVPPASGAFAAEPSPHRIPGYVTIERVIARFDVHIWGTSAAEVISLYGTLSAKLDIYYGPKGGRAPTGSNPARAGYEFGAASRLDAVATVSGSVATVVPAALKDFVHRATRPTAPILDVPVQVDLVDADGGTDTAISSEVVFS